MYVHITRTVLHSLAWEAETIEQARETLTEHLYSSSLRDRDAIINRIQRMKSLEALHKYLHSLKVWI